MFYFDHLYMLFMLPGLLIGISAQIKLSSAYGKYTQVPVESGMSGAEAAQKILDRAGVAKVFGATPLTCVAALVSDRDAIALSRFSGSRQTLTCGRVTP